MRIEKIFIKDIGPFDDKEIDFRDKWTGEISPQVLLSGPNGFGKTTVLNCISYLWKALGYWLYEKKELPKNDPIKKYIGPKGNCAMIIDGIPDFTDLKSSKTQKIIVFISSETTMLGSSFLEKIRGKNNDIYFMGEYFQTHKKVHRLISSFPLFEYDIIPDVPIVDERDRERREQEAKREQEKKKEQKAKKELFFKNWTEEYKTIILSGSNSKTPNMGYLDAEERRWVKAEKNIGKPVQENMSNRWLYKYVASNAWNTQLEASLITLKTTSLHKFHEIVRLLNTLLMNKEILPDIHPGENRLRVNIKNKRGAWHTFDQLSAGEREMLVLVYSIARWMEEGGVALLDEPDLFLHPGIMPDTFSVIEKLVEEKGGQLIITSHFPEIWERYENRAMRINLELGAPNE